MGVVYQAEHRLMERTVALKVIHARLLSSNLAVERFRLEVKAAAKLSHRNIVTAFDAEQAGDLHFLVMEYIEGTSLADLVHRRGPLSVLHACNYILQAAKGLQHAYEKGMVHRDIKPHNLMHSKRGVIKVLDFGLARFASQQQAESGDTVLTRDGATVGTPDYIAPEQARNSRQADIRADIYSLGCTLYFLLAGRPPFPTGTAIEKVLAHCERTATPLSSLRDDVPPAVSQIVLRMMDKDPLKRFQTPAELVDALRPFGKRDSSNSDGVSASTIDDAGEGATAWEVVFGAAQDKTTVLPTLESQASSVPITKRVDSPWTRDVRLWLGIAAAGLIAAFFFFDFPHVAPELNVEPPGMTRLPDQAEPEGGSADSGPAVAASPGSETLSDGWVDLLPRIDPEQHAVVGQWSRAANGLAVQAERGARLMLPYKPGPAYDFEVVFTRQTGVDSIALLFVIGSGQAAFDVDGWGTHLAGIQNIDGRTMQDNGTGVGGFALDNGRRYTARVRVRPDRVDAFLDGRPVTTYLGDGSNLSILHIWELPRSDALGIGAYDSTTTFHEIKIRPVRE